MPSETAELTALTNRCAIVNETINTADVEF